MEKLESTLAPGIQYKKAKQKLQQRWKDFSPKITFCKNLIRLVYILALVVVLYLKKSHHDPKQADDATCSTKNDKEKRHAHLTTIKFKVASNPNEITLQTYTAIKEMGIYAKAKLKELQEQSKHKQETLAEKDYEKALAFLDEKMGSILKTIKI